MSAVPGQSSFVYLAGRPEGGYRVGVVRGKDQRHAQALLRQRRLLPVGTVSLPTSVIPASKGGHAPLKDQAELHLQLGQLTSRGVPLVEALDVVAQSVSQPVGERVRSVRDMVSAGSSFSQASERTKLFDGVTTAVYASAERTGDIAGAAKQLATSARRQLAIRGKVATLLMYPLIVFSISLIVSIFLMTYIVPKVGRTLEEQLRASGGQLPVYTRVLMAVGEFMRDQWLWLALGLLAAAFVAVAAHKSLVALGSAMLHRVPVLKDVVLAQESARFFTVMAAMTRSGIPLADALAVGATAIHHPRLRAQLSTLRTRLIEGGVLRTLIDGVTALPVGTRKLLIAAERSGDLESAFDTLGQDMTEELERRSMRLLSVLEPMLIVVMAVMIGGLLLSIMIPMLTVAGQLG